MNNNRLMKQILIPGYIQFVLCIIFWIGVALGLFKNISLFIYILMASLFLCALLVIGATYLFDRFYLKNINDTLQNLDDLNMKLRTQRHEYLNEMQVVYGLLELQEYDEALSYLKPVYADIAKVGKALKTARPAVNALLQSKMEKAQRCNTDLYIEVSSDLSQITMEQWDICKVLGNLIDNSITAVSLNEKEKKVHVCIQENSQNYLFLVYNNGPEIPENKRELIFKKGYTSKKEAGHGLGLGIVKEIVNRNHGEIKLRSNAEKTEFEVIIRK